MFEEEELEPSLNTYSIGDLESEGVSTYTPHSASLSLVSSCWNSASVSLSDIIASSIAAY